MIDGSKKRIKSLLRFEFQSSHVLVNRNKFALKNKLHQLHVMQCFSLPVLVMLHVLGFCVITCLVMLTVSLTVCTRCP